MYRDPSPFTSLLGQGKTRNSNPALSDSRTPPGPRIFPDLWDHLYHHCSANFAVPAIGSGDFQVSRKRWVKFTGHLRFDDPLERGKNRVDVFEAEKVKEVYPGKLTWNLKMDLWKATFLQSVGLEWIDVIDSLWVEKWGRGGGMKGIRMVKI